MRRGDRMSSEDVRIRAEKIWRAGLRVHDLIETILSYTRLNTGAITPNPSQINLSDLVQRVCEDQLGTEPTRSFRLDLNNLPEQFLGDPVLLEQALVIILSNAMKYSPVEEPVHVTGKMQNGIITIVVDDHGIGVSDRDLPFLMQPFFRGKNAEGTPGTGLGLSLAWHILRLHGGSLQIQKRQRGGTRVTMMLPENAMLSFGNGI